jgi:hypothetical protein
MVRAGHDLEGVVILEVELCRAHEVPEELRRTHVVEVGEVGMVNTAAEGMDRSSDLGETGVGDLEGLPDTAPTSNPREAVAGQAVVAKGRVSAHHFQISDGWRVKVPVSHCEHVL